MPDSNQQTEGPLSDEQKEALESAKGALDATKTQLAQQIDASDNPEEIEELGGYVEEAENGTKEIDEALAPA